MNYYRLLLCLMLSTLLSFSYAPDYWEVLEQLTYSIDVDENSFDMVIVPIYTDKIKELEGKTIRLEAYWCEDLNQNMTVDGVQLSRTRYIAWDAHMPSDGEMVALDLIEGVQWEDGKRYTIKGQLELQGTDYDPLPYRLNNVEIISK